MGAKKMHIPKFLTKKEKEAKELLDKKQKQFKEKQKRLKELEKEIVEMQELVFSKIKDPAIKRRHTLTSFREMLPPAEQARPNLPSCFGDDVSFNEVMAQKETKRQTRVEWRAQFKRIDAIVEKQRKTRWEEKQLKRDKSSDARLIQNQLIHTIN